MRADGVEALPRTAIAIARAIRARRSLILLYHGVGEPEPDADPHNLQVSPAAFSRQLDLLSAAGFRFVTVAELARRIDRRPPPGLIALSFDDGMQDNHDVVAPMLAARGIPATFYPLAGALGQPNPWLDPSLGARLMTSEELRELREGGFEIGAHSMTHPDMSALPYRDCLEEMRESRDRLQSIVGAPVVTFAYPFGHYGEEAAQAAAAAGFEAAVTCVNRGSWERYELKRTLITGRDTISTFLARIAGVYEPLVLGGPGAFARRATGPLRYRLRSVRGGS